MKHKVGEILKCKRSECDITFKVRPKIYQLYCCDKCRQLDMSKKIAQIREKKRKSYGWMGYILTDEESACTCKRDNYFEEPLLDQMCHIIPRRSYHAV